MADGLIGALRVLLGVDTAAFSEGLDKATGKLEIFGVNFQKLAGGLAITGIAAGFVYDINKMINAADALGKASQKYGVPVEQLSALKFAADMTEVSFESLEKGLGKLSKTLLDAVVEPGGKAGKIFAALGISATDSNGKMKDTTTILGDVAEKFNKLGDTNQRTAAAMKLFGKSGAELIPLLAQGKDGIKELTDEAARLGIVIDANTAARAEEFNQTLKRLHATHDSIVLQITQGMLPGLQTLADAMLTTARNGTTMREVGGYIVEAFNKIVEVVFTTIAIFQRLGAEWQALQNFLHTDIFSGGLTAAWAAFNAEGVKTQQVMAGIRAQFAAPDADALAWMGATATKQKKAFGELNTSVMGSKSSLDSFLDSQLKSIAGHEAEALAIGLGLGVREKLKVQLEAEQIARNNNIKLTEKQNAAIAAVGQRAADAAIDVAAANMKVDLLSPWEKYEQKLKDVNAILERHPELAAQAAQSAGKAAAAMAESYGTAAASAMGSMAEFFTQFGQGNATMFAIGKAFSISQAIINTLVGATKAYAEFGWPLGAVFAAAVIAGGMAQVAKIASQQPAAKMATGGSFMLGGAGGVDSQMVPIMATPGERVSVDQNKYGESAGGQTMTVQGISAKEYYRGDVLRDIISNINQAVSDGYKIKVA
jgi:TP901 family phage tail tape measure protein